MNSRSIQRFCINGTEAYLDFLEENNRGLQKIGVMNKDTVPEMLRPTFKLTLSERLFDPDSIAIEICPPGQIYGPDYFKVAEYDADAKTLIVEVVNPAMPLDVARIQGLRVISDLRFLVRNVMQWYSANGRGLRCPEKAPEEAEAPATDEQEQTHVRLESCQQEAVKTCLNSPLTYVWGPPGTGKTKHVLAQAALSMLLRGKRVGIFAPTNNALEQAVAAAIRAAETAGMSMESILRVGHPSAKFARDYPEVCEVLGLQRRLCELRDQISVYEKVLDFRRGKTVLNSIAMLNDELGRVRDLLTKRNVAYQEVARLSRSLLVRAFHVGNGRVWALKADLEHLESEINGRFAMIKQHKTASPRLNAIVQGADFTNLDKAAAAISELEQGTQQAMALNKALADDYAGQSDADIALLITGAQEQAATLRAQDVMERVKAVSLVGMTLDCFIGRFSDVRLPLDHIFLDEAGYAPVVKALTLCRDNIPVTLIGDHMQLGPVCEMDDDNRAAAPAPAAVIWRKSALYLDEFFEAVDDAALVAQLRLPGTPRLHSFARADLTKTFRFGQNLANILARHAYNGLALVSARENQQLKIVVLDAVPSGAQSPDRKNGAEVQVIRAFLDAQVDLDWDPEDSIAILAPYKGQVALLGQALPDARRQGRIMTIHKSQGREWDTVIISIVDGHFNHPWFTNSLTPQSGGLQVINTAISRARKRLVIACDEGYWKNRQNQLVGAVIRNAG